jgi:hypothetical protein
VIGGAASARSMLRRNALDLGETFVGNTAATWPSRPMRNL